MLIDHDVHVHTILSACCHDPEATPKNILRRAREKGLNTIGFADHMWALDCSGASPWYIPQDLEHVNQTRTQLPADSGGIRILVGCESEYGGAGKLGISAAAASQLDFVLLPMSHLHMRGFVAPAELSDPTEVGAFMVQRFLEVLDTGLANGIAHPFLPCGHKENADKIIASISDETFACCFQKAAAANVSIEITMGFFPGCQEGGETEDFHDTTFIRMLAIAKNQGCNFHFASDTHTLIGVGNVLKLEPYVQELGLTANDIAPWVQKGKVSKP